MRRNQTNSKNETSWKSLIECLSSKVKTGKLFESENLNGKDGYLKKKIYDLKIGLVSLGPNKQLFIERNPIVEIIF